MKRVFFFATPFDITPVLSRFESQAPLKFVPTGMLETPNRPIYLNAKEIPSPGIATDETGSFSTTYLVSPRDIKNRVYTYTADTGQRQCLLTNGDNEYTILLTLAGLWKTGTLLPGGISTLHQTPTAQQLMQRFSAALKEENFTKFGVYWLGREALAMLKAGKRLVQAEQSPREFDLKWSEVGHQRGSTPG